MEPCKQHTFRDFCNTSEHSQAFVASQLNNPVKGVELYKESYSKDKIKTINVALVICLNMDIDPPDVQKIPPYSRVEAWIDPADAGYRVVDMIGKNLQSQYERWQPKGCYRQCLDPNLEEVKKICLNMRRNARSDRILFHYNGHGVPRPTENGEIWVFNRTFTKYIPLSLCDLQHWLGGPSVYVIECQNAGRVLKLYDYFCQRRQTEMANAPDSNNGMSATDGVQHEGNVFGHAYASHVSGMSQMAAAVAAAVAPASMDNTIMLCACEENEDLPQLADLPADLFTACLTTPIRTALRWHWMKYNKSFPGHIDEALLDHIPGTHGNRMSLLGEINWIFTAVTDTIAWCSFPVDLFQKLFRQDLLVASIFRNYLLAQRLMRAFGCHPCSWPRLNPTHDHPIWSAWDHSLDLLFHYLPQVLSAMQTSPQTDLMLLTQQHQKQHNLPLLFSPPPTAPPGGMGDVPRDLLELTSASAQRLTVLLNEVDRQVEEAKQLKALQAESRPEGKEERAGDGESEGVLDRLATNAPPGYEPAGGPVAKSHHHVRGSTPVTPTLSPKRTPKFVVQTRDLSRISEEEPVVENAVGVAKSTAGGAQNKQPHSCPPNLLPSQSSRIPREADGGGQHPPHHHGCDSEESEFSSSDIDVDEDDETEDEEDEEEEEEEEEEDDVDDDLVGAKQEQAPRDTTDQHQPLHQLQKFKIQLTQQPPPKEATPEVPKPPPCPSLVPTHSFRAGPCAGAGGGGNNSTYHRPPISAASLLARCSQPRAAPVIGPTPLPLVHNPMPPDYRPASFFTTQMTAFQAWLRYASSNPSYRQRQSAIQLPILLQVLLSQTHRIRALQLLSEFLDLGPWAVCHCITVGILPYIVRLFHSNVLEVKPHLVFIWGKIISSAVIDFSRHEGIRESGYKYFVACLQDSSNLSPLVRTMAAFALAKMLVRGETGAPDALFQEVYYTSKPFSFIHVAAEELTRASAAAEAGAMRDGHSFDHLKVWLLLALGRVWFHCNEARWLAVKADGGRVVETGIIPRLCDADPVVRAAAVFALGTLIDQSGGEGKKNSLEADRLNHQVGIRLVERTRDPSTLVRCEVVVALRSLVMHCESRMVEQAHLYYLNILKRLQIAPTVINSTSSQATVCSVGSPAAAATLLRGMAELSISRLGRSSRSRSHKDSQSSAIIEPSSVALADAMDDANGKDSVPSFVEDFEPNVPGGIFEQLWDTVLVLAADPHVSVAKLANVIFLHIVQELIRRYDIDREVVVINGRLFLRGAHTPPAEDGASVASAESHAKTPTQSPLQKHQQQQSIGAVAQQLPRRRHVAGSDNSGPGDNPNVMEVQTDFFQWCSHWFSQPLLHKYPEALHVRPSTNKTSPHSMDPPTLPSKLNPQSLTDLSSISTNSEAMSFSEHLLRFRKHNAARFEGRQRWHSISTGQKSASSSSAASIAAENDETRRYMRHIVHRASRAASPLSPTRRNCRHGNRFTNDSLRFCSTTVAPHLGSSVDTEAAEAGERVRAELQLLHIFQPDSGLAVGAKFHPYKPHLLAAKAGATGEEYAVSVYGVHRLERVHQLTLKEDDSTRRPSRTGILLDCLAEEIKRQRALTEAYELAQVTSMELLNTLEERSLLLTASRDGCIRVWQNYDGKGGTAPRLLTAWVAFENQVPFAYASRTAGVGLVTSWSECSLHHLLHVSGDVRVVRTFDTDREVCVAEFDTHANCPVTCLARAADDNDHIFAAGFADSRLKIFDTRLPPSKAIVYETVCDANGGSRVLDLAFAPYQADRRLYAVTGSGAVGAWQLDSPSTNAAWHSIVPSAGTEVVGDVGVPSPTAPRRGVKKACLQVSLPCTRSHLVAYGGLRQFSVARLHDGRVIASYQPMQALCPTAIAIHPYEPLIAVGMNDASIHLLKFRLPQNS